MNQEDEIANLKAEIVEIQKRNKRVEADKAWEKSFARTFCIAVITYIIAALVLFLINSTHPFRDALIPTVGFYLSTLSLPLCKKWWIKRHKIWRANARTG